MCSALRPAAAQFRLLLLFSLVLLLGGASASESRDSAIPAHSRNGVDETASQLALVPYASGLNSPVGVVGADDGRLFVLERQGVIRIILPGGSIVPEPFLDISDRVDASFIEEGLLGLALHPEFSSNGRFFLNYINTTAGMSRTRISSFLLSDSPNVGDPNSEDILLTIDQPYENHNGGHILFGPDEFLYIPLGDGGNGGDPGDRAQDPSTPLGKVLRIDVDANSSLPPDCSGVGSGNYRVPNANPMTDGAGGACDEIWDLGLRNPWRSSFDRESGDLFIGDVGQGTWEELDLHIANDLPGWNFGWRCYEGNHPFNTIGCGPADDYVGPIFEYNHEGNGCAIISGYAYRGLRYPTLNGHFFLTDYCSGILWELVPDGLGDWNSIKHTNVRRYGFSAFGEGCDGELYLANIDNGTIYRFGIEDETAASAEQHIAQSTNTVQLDDWLYLPLMVKNTCD